MRLPTQPKTVKPKVKTITNMIQSRFTLVPSLCRGTPGPAPSIPFLRYRNQHGPLHASHECIRMPSSSSPLPRETTRNAYESCACPGSGKQTSGVLHLITLRVHNNSGGSVVREGGPAPIPQRFDPVPHSAQER